MFAGKDARQKKLLLRGVAEILHDRRQHLQSEDVLRRSAGLGALLLENMLLHHIPARAAELGGPIGRAPALCIQNLLPTHHVVLGNMPPHLQLVADVLG